MPVYRICKRTRKRTRRLEIDIPECIVVLPTNEELAADGAHEQAEKVRERLSASPSPWQGLGKSFVPHVRSEGDKVKMPSGGAADRMAASTHYNRIDDVALTKALKAHMDRAVFPAFPKTGRATKGN